MTTEKCLESAVKIETLLRDVYAGLADRHAGDPEMAELFRDLAREEEQHAHRIRLLARHQGEGIWARNVAARIVTQLDAMSGELVSLVTELTRETDRSDPADVLRRVVDAEFRCGFLHAELLAETAEIEVQMLFTSRAKQDLRHKELLDGADRWAARRPPPLPVARAG